MAITGTANAAATGTLVDAPCKLVALWVRATATGGSVVLRDNGAGGTTKLTLDTPASASVQVLEIPSGGLEFKTDVHATLTSVDGITALYV